MGEVCGGSRGGVAVGFEKTGSLGWYGNAALGTWGADPGQDKASALAVGWPTANRAAIQTTPYVGPGQVMWFQFSVEAPATPGTYKLGLRPVLEGQEWLEDPGLTFYVLVKADDDHLPADPTAIAPAAPVARTYLPATLVDGSRVIRVPSLMYHYVSWLPATDPNIAPRTDLTASTANFAAM